MDLSTTYEQGIVHVIDDEERLRNSLCDLLQSMGYATNQYESAEAFLECLPERDDHPQCIVLDFRMPGLTGLELKQELIRLNCNLPAVLLTGFRDDHTDRRADELGFVAVMEKPFPPPNLTRMVKYALSLPESSNQEIPKLSNSIPANSDAIEATSKSTP